MDGVSTVELRETETFWLLDEPGVSVGVDSAAAAHVREANEAYAELLRKRADMSDMFVASAAQTLVRDKKTKEVQAAAPVTFECGTQATAWEIHDHDAGVNGDSATADGELDVAVHLP